MFIFTVGCYCAGLVPKTLNEGEILLVLLVGLYWIWEGMCWGTVKAFENWVWVWVILIGWLKLPFKLWLDFGSSWCWLMLLKFKKCWLWWVLLGVWVPKDIVLKSLDMVTVTVPPALPACMSIGISFALARFFLKNYLIIL